MPINQDSSNINPNTGLPYTREEVLINTRFNSMNAGKANLSPLDTRFSAGQTMTLESPEELATYTDKGVTLQVGGANEEVRAENQSAGEQLARGLIKMVGLTATTFADGTVGTVVGLGSLLTGGSFIDNPFSNAMLDINDKMEKRFANYYTAENADAFSGIIPFTEGSANFWGDKILKNFGFALGAYGAGLVTAGLGGMAAEKIMANRAGKAIIATLQTEGKSSAEIQKMLEAVKAGDNAAIDLMKPSEKVLEAIKADAKLAQRLDVANQWMSSVGGAVGESRVEALGNSREFKEKELSQLRDKYGDNIPQAELDDLDERTNNYMNTTFGINMALLTLFDYTQFSDAFKTKYAKQRILNEGIEGTIEKGFSKEAMSKGEMALKLAKNPIAEGTQEQLQYATQKGGDNYYSKRYDDSGKEIVNNFIDSYVKGLGEAYGTAEGWEQFATGAIIGALGMPNIKKLTGKDGLVQGGIYGEYKDIKDEEASVNKRVADLNKAAESIKNNDNLKDIYEHLVRAAKLSGEQREALLKGDKAEYKNKEEDKFLSEVLAFHEAGKLEDLEDFYAGLAEKKGADIRKTQETKDKNGKAIDSFKGLTDAEIESQFKKKSQDALEKIKTIRELKEDIDGRFANMPDSYREELLHYGYTIKNVDKRFGELSKEIAQKTSGAYIKTRDEKGNLVETPLEIPEDPIKFAEYVNKEEGKKEFDKAIKDYVKRHPEDNQLKEKAKDLIKLANRRKEFTEKYIEGLTDGGQKKLLKEIKDAIGDQIKKNLEREEARTKFSTDLLNKGYSLDKSKNIDGIFIKYGDQLLKLQTVNGQKVVVDPQTGETIIKFKDDTQFDDFLLTKGDKINILSKEEAGNHLKNIKNNQIRQAELQALKQLVQQTKTEGKELNKKIQEKSKELENKVKELNKLLNDYKNSTVSDPIFISEVEDLILDLEIAIDDIQRELESLTRQRNNLRELYKFYTEEFTKLAASDTFIDYKDQANQERITRNIIKEDLDPKVTLNEVNDSINYLENLIELYEKQLATYEKQKDVLQAILDEDKDLRDFLENTNFQEVFEQKYPAKLRRKVTYDFLRRFVLNASRQNLDPGTIRSAEKVFKLVEQNPAILDDLTSLLEHKIELEKTNRRLKFNTAEVEMVDSQINRVSEALKGFKKELESLKDTKEKIEYLNKPLSTAYATLRNRIAAIFKKNEFVRPIEEAPFNERGETGEFDNKEKESAKAENAKKGTPYSTTGVVIKYKYNPKTDSYEDVLDNDGNPVYTTSESQLRWGKFLDDNVNELEKGDSDYMIQFHIHDSSATDNLNKEISENTPVEAREEGNDVYAVIVRKDGSPVLVNGKYLFTGIHKVSTLFPGNGEVRLLNKKVIIEGENSKFADLLYVPETADSVKVTIGEVTKTKKEWLQDPNWENIKEAEIVRIIDSVKTKFEAVRNTIKQTIKKDGKAYSTIKKVSNGIPITGKTTREANDLLGPTFELQLNEFNKRSGLWYAISKDGKRIPVETNLLGNVASANGHTMVDVIVKLLQHAMPVNSTEVIEYFNLPKGQTLGTETRVPIFPTGKGQTSLLGSIIHYGRNKKGEQPRKFMIWGKESITYINSNGQRINVSREALHNPKSKAHQDLRDFLATKKLNISKKASESNLYFYEPIIDAKGNLATKQHSSDKGGSENFQSGYKKFIRKHLRTRLLKTEDNKPLFTNRYIVYGTIKPTVPTKKAKPVTKTKTKEADINEMGLPSDMDLSSFGMDLSGYDLDEAMEMTGETAKTFKSGNTSVKEEKDILKDVDATNSIEANPVLDSSNLEFDASEFGIDLTTPESSKERVVSLTKEDALKRLKELIQEGIVDKKCD